MENVESGICATSRREASVTLRLRIVVFCATERNDAMHTEIRQSNETRIAIIDFFAEFKILISL